MVSVLRRWQNSFLRTFSRTTQVSRNQNYSILDVLEPQMMDVKVTTGDSWNYKTCKAPVIWSPPKNQHPVLLQPWMPFPSPNQQCESTERKMMMMTMTVIKTKSLITLCLVSFRQCFDVGYVTENASWHLQCPAVLICETFSDPA